jgi:soluble lytic murein transglycosylase-like protein
VLSRLPRAALAGVLLLALSRAAAAREIVVPLQLDHAFLRQLLLRQVYTGPDQTARVWDDGSGCNFLVLSEPQVDGTDDRLRIRSAARARTGLAIGSVCITPIDWSGTVEILEQPVLDPVLPVVRFHVVDSNLYGKDGAKHLSGTLWDWVKSAVHPRLEAVRVDLTQPLDELRTFLPLVLPAENAEQAAHLLDSLTLAAARAGASGLTVDLRFDIAERGPAPTAPAPEPTLTVAELARWEAAWQQWDAFLTFVSKHVGADTPDAAQRQALFDVLIAARYDILWVLRPSSPNEPDPVPALFVKTWTRLAPLLRTLSLGLPGEAALRYLSFITAADALRAIQESGPESGLDISADGLRRLARMIAPSDAEDPLAYSDAIDPALRELFGFGAPLPTPADNPDVDLSWWMPAPAWAESDLAARLNRWAPTREDAQEYLPLVRDLLTATAQRTVAKQSLDDRFHELFGWLTLATAWKESCWRQYVLVGGRLRPIRSPVGAVGIMQVNPRVWRGFYDVKGLSQDIAYNAMAGAEILLHYLRDYAIARGEHSVTGAVDNLARAAYAAYNGGPGHLTRYRKNPRNRGLRRIDESFWEKYRKIKSGQTLAVAECFGA